MPNHNDSYDWIYAKLALFFAGCAGAFVSLNKERKLTFLQRVSSIVSGGLIAHFITPVTISFLKLGEGGLLFMAFIIGFCGFKSVEIAIDEVRKRFPLKK